MALNPAADYGLDLACVDDADELFTEAEGIDVVIQDAIHRLTTDDVLGPGGDGWGFDCKRLLGLPVQKLAAYQPVLAEVLQRDDRIATADVTLTPTTINGIADVLISVTCETAAGPFSFVKAVSELTEADLVAGTT